jgi:hypothetical protein
LRAKLLFVALSSNSNNLFGTVISRDHWPSV